jgi:hypothetical protein
MAYATKAGDSTYLPVSASPTGYDWMLVGR